MIGVDTSVVVPALVSWHPDHSDARGVAADSLVAAHARLESYSVLTQLPPPHRLAPEIVDHLLDGWFPSSRTVIPSSGVGQGIVSRCRRAGVAGGAVYDALIALTPSEVDATLVTRDRRAVETYRRLGIASEMM